MKFSFFDGRRYGWDNLSKFLMIVSVPLLFSRFTFIIGFVILGYALWRCFSMDFSGRRREEAAFQNWARKGAYDLDILKQKLKMQFQGVNNKVRQSRDYKIFKCPQCSQKLRVPRHKGKILVTCRNCSHKFQKRT